MDQLDLKGQNCGDDKKVFLNTLIARGNAGWLWSPHKWGDRKGEGVLCFLCSVFKTDNRLRVSQCSELEKHGCENDKLTVKSEIERDLLVWLHHYKSIRLDGNDWGSSKSWLMLLWHLCQWFLNGLENLKSQLTGSWLTLSQSSKWSRRMSLETLACQSHCSAC